MPEPALREISDKTIIYNLPPDVYHSGSWDEQHDKAKGVTNFEVYVTPTVNQNAEELFVVDGGTGEPYTQADILDSVEDQVQDLIFRIRKSRHEKLASRLLSLYNEANEEDPTSVGISLGSLSNFHHFLEVFGNLKKPSITLTDDNNIYTSWKTECRLFSMHFLPDGIINFVIFSPNHRNPERKDRVSGTATADTLEKIVAPEIFHWITQ